MKESSTIPIRALSRVLLWLLLTAWMGSGLHAQQRPEEEQSCADLERKLFGESKANSEGAGTQNRATPSKKTKDPTFPGSDEASRYFRVSGSSKGEVAGGDSETRWPVAESAEELGSWLRCLRESCRTAKARCKIGDAILNTVFGIRRHELADVIVYLEVESGSEPDEDEESTKTGKEVSKEASERKSLKGHPPALIWRKENTPYLFGVDQVWVLVLSEHRIELDAEIVTLFEKTENPFQGLFGLLSVQAIANADAAKAKAVKSKKEAIKWSESVLRFPEGNDDKGAVHLYLGTVRLPVAPESVNYLSLVPAVRGSSPEGLSIKSALPDAGNMSFAFSHVAREEEKKEKSEDNDEKPPSPDFHLISAHFSNSRVSRLAFSVGLAATLNAEDTSLGTDGSETHFNGYALGKIYLRRPRVKAFLENGGGRRTRLSVGFVAGTSIEDPFDEVVAGISLGHIFGKTGLFVGMNRVPATEEIERKWRPILGVDYTF